jgi:hypothetical protein
MRSAIEIAKQFGLTKTSPSTTSNYSGKSRTTDSNPPLQQRSSTKRERRKTRTAYFDWALDVKWLDEKGTVSE